MKHSMDSMTLGPAPKRWNGLVLALLLGLGFGAVSAAIAIVHVQQLLGDRVADWLGAQSLVTAAIVRAVTWFLGAHLLLHLAFGFFAWLLAVGTERYVGFVQLRRRTSVLVWFAVLTVWALANNTVQFPQSLAGELICCAMVPAALLRNLAAFATGVLVVVGAFMGWSLLKPHPKTRRIASRAILYGSLAVAGYVLIDWVRLSAIADEPVAAGSPPNIIIIGIDSLRKDFIGADGHQSGFTPNVDAFLQEGVVFEDAVTPLGRTFAAWVAILTGRSPVSTGIRENLLQVPQAVSDASVAHILRRAGYETVYATDEVRFSNIDESFGFDRILSPPMGVTDFLLGSFNDLPLANLIANSRLGGLLFPNTYANRAAAVTYEPSTFVERVAADIEAARDKPLFLSMHLALPHWPFDWADMSQSGFSRLADIRYQYAAAVLAVDRQFGELTAVLERKGLLRNAIVVVLSDHGEGMGMPRDNLLYDRAAKQAVGPLEIATWGHGNSVLSPFQSSVVLGLRGFGGSSLATRGAVSLPALEYPASLEDVAPTVLGFAGVKAGLPGSDGVDWSAQLRGRVAVSPEVQGRVRFIETGYIIGFSQKGDVDATEVAAGAVSKYFISPTTGRINVRNESIPALLREKHRAALSGGLLLAAIPDRNLQRTRFLLVDTRTGAVRELLAPPAEQDSAPYRLWQALQQRYGSELQFAQ
jgi:arylsulfatase A-like enzyme